MEEWVGRLWHKAVTRAARRDFPEAAVTLEEMRQPAAVMFRALGGERGLRIAAARETAHGARRRWLQRLAGSGKQVELAWREEETLRLPARIAWFAQRELNRDLYNLWLVANGFSRPRLLIHDVFVPGALFLMCSLLWMMLCTAM